MCERADLEKDRLELGWLIGNIFSLNKIHDLDRLGAPGGERGLEEYARLTNWYEKKEKIWYQWAFAKIEYKKKKLPRIYADSEASWEGIGKYKCRIEGSALHVKWSVKNNKQRDVAFLDLCNNVGMTSLRNELGVLIADIIHQASLDALSSIPGPKEAMHHASMLKREEALWRHWAIVPPGQMLFV